MDEDDFETVKKEAYSLVPGDVPSGMERIYVEETKYGTVIYYFDANTGKYFYQSESTERFHKELMEKVKEKKLCSRRLRNISKKQSA